MIQRLMTSGDNDKSDVDDDDELEIIDKVADKWGANSSQVAKRTWSAA